jgi:hypothetical protein
METIELTDTVTQVENAMIGLSNRLEGTEERFHEVNERTIEITKSE